MSEPTVYADDDEFLRAIIAKLDQLHPEADGLRKQSEEIADHEYALIDVAEYERVAGMLEAIHEDVMMTLWARFPNHPELLARAGDDDDEAEWVLAPIAEATEHDDDAG